MVLRGYRRRGPQLGTSSRTYIIVGSAFRLRVGRFRTEDERVEYSLRMLRHAHGDLRAPPIVMAVTLPCRVVFRLPQLQNRVVEPKAHVGVERVDYDLRILGPRRERTGSHPDHGAVGFDAP